MNSTLLALCLGLTGAGRAEPSVDPYPAAYAATLSDHAPLLVFVGQPAREVSGARSIAVSTFPDAAASSVVVGVVRDGGLIRTDLAGTPATPDIQTAVAGLSYTGSGEALDEVNAARAARGLRPFIRDAYLTAGAVQAAEFRAARLIEGHTANDFAALPPGGFATSAGCAAWEPGTGWGSCCTYEQYTYAGAAYARGRDGRRYMHLFVR
ncbi:MAG TPA: hypothetical protein VH120_19840 [Gemmataceae bacterium]|nr:hypothetical protein [Gemmataceae bacterium]